MNRIIILVIALFFLNHCSLNDKSRIWKKGEDKLESQKNFKKVFEEDKKIETEFNQELKLDLSSIIPNNKISDIKNNYGSQKYDGLTIKSGNYKFSKFVNINQLNFKPIFLDDGLIFFDNKGSIIRFNSNQKVLWKKKSLFKIRKEVKT